MRVIDLPRVRAALTALDRLLAAHPELRRGGARLSALFRLAEEAHVDVDQLDTVAAEEAHVDVDQVVHVDKLDAEEASPAPVVVHVDTARDTRRNDID